jgi:transcriptional regulator with XRE-family HTH domain
MCRVRKVRSRGFPGNYLKKMRECAGLSQRALGQRLALDATRITRIERDQVHLAGAFDLIVAWARACGYGPWDVGLQRFLVESGNPPWLPPGDPRAVLLIARRAAALALLPRASDREIAARRLAQHHAAERAAPGVARTRPGRSGHVSADRRRRSRTYSAHVGGLYQRTPGSRRLDAPRHDTQLI